MYIVHYSTSFCAGRQVCEQDNTVENLVLYFAKPGGHRLPWIKAQRLWQSLAGTLRGGIPGKVRRVKGRMLYWLTVKQMQCPMLSNPKYKGKQRQNNSSLCQRDSPQLGNVYVKRIYSQWAYWYCCQVPAKSQGKDPGMAFLCQGRRQRKWTTSLYIVSSNSSLRVQNIHSLINWIIPRRLGLMRGSSLKRRTPEMIGGTTNAWGVK